MYLTINIYPSINWRIMIDSTKTKDEKQDLGVLYLIPLKLKVDFFWIKPDWNNIFL